MTPPNPADSAAGVAEKTVATTEPKVVPASTEISTAANAKVVARCEKDDRSRAYVLRQIIHEWADRQPTPKGKKDGGK